MPSRTLGQIVDQLNRLGPTQFDLPTVQQILGDGALDEASLRPYIHQRADKYARYRVHRSPLFELLVLTWLPGQATPIHNHAGNLGWVRLVRGRIAEQGYKLVPSTVAQGLDVAADVAAVRRSVELVATGRAVVTEIGAVATVDRQRAIHRLGNPREHAGDEVAVTLHVYSRPHDVCLVFDQEARTCGRRELVCDNAVATA